MMADIWLDGERDELLQTVETTVVEKPITVELIIRLIKLAGEMSIHDISAEAILSGYVTSLIRTTKNGRQTTAEEQRSEVR
jgi:hypothetical protein